MTEHSGIIILTGASGGIGRATALALGQEGFTLALVGRSEEGLAETQAQVQATGAKSQTFTQDLTAYGSLPGLVDRIVAALGSPIGLINNAGMVQTGSLETMDLDQWDAVLALNLKAPLALIQQVIPHLRNAGGGVIVNLASVAGLRTFPNWGAYCASKFGLVALGRTLAEELRPDRIRVCTLCPGAVDTALWNTLGGDFDRSRMLAPHTVAQMIVQMFLLPAEAVLEEVVLMPTGGAL